MATVAMFLGTFRLLHLDANDNVIAESLEKLASEFGIVAANTAIETDPQKMPKVKKNRSTIFKEDDKLLVRMKAVGSETSDIDQFTPEVRIPITFRNARTGVVYEKTLYYSDFTDLLVAAGDQTLAAGQWYDWLTYTIPAQSELKLGHDVQDVRVDSALNLAVDLNKA